MDTVLIRFVYVVFQWQDSDSKLLLKHINDHGHSFGFLQATCLCNKIHLRLRNREDLQRAAGAKLAKANW